MYEPSRRQRHVAAVTVASAVLAGVFYVVGLGRVANALAAVAGVAATWLLYSHGKRRGGGGGNGGNDRRRREKEMEAEVGGSGGHF